MSGSSAIRPIVSRLRLAGGEKAGASKRGVWRRGYALCHATEPGKASWMKQQIGLQPINCRLAAHWQAFQPESASSDGTNPICRG